MKEITASCRLKMKFPDDMDLESALEILLLHVDMDIDIMIDGYEETTVDQAT